MPRTGSSIMPSIGRGASDGDSPSGPRTGSQKQDGCKEHWTIVHQIPLGGAAFARNGVAPDTQSDYIAPFPRARSSAG